MHSPERWMRKAQHEGGIAAGLEYGLGSESYLNLGDPKFEELVRVAASAYAVYAVAEDNLMEYAYEQGYAEVPRP